MALARSRRVGAAVEVMLDSLLVMGRAWPRQSRPRRRPQRGVIGGCILAASRDAQNRDFPGLQARIGSGNPPVPKTRRPTVMDTDSGPGHPCPRMSPAGTQTPLRESQILRPKLRKCLQTPIYTMYFPKCASLEKQPRKNRAHSAPVPTSGHGPSSSVRRRVHGRFWHAANAGDALR